MILKAPLKPISISEIFSNVKARSQVIYSLYHVYLSQCNGFLNIYFILKLQWSLYFKTTHGSKKMRFYIAGGLKIKVI